jgi:hypothetical protein
MKNQFRLAIGMARPGLFGLALAGLMLLTVAESSSAAEVLAPSSLPYGYSYQEWAAKWWQYYLGQDTNKLELVGKPDNCKGPASRVRFLEGNSESVTKTNHITIPTDTPLFFTVLGFNADNTACPITEFTSLMADQLAAEVVGAWSATTLTTCTIDGVAVAGLEDPTNTIYDVVSAPFSYTTAEEGNMLGVVEGEYCIPGGLTIYPAVTDGLYLMISPFSRGKHTIHWVEVSPYQTSDITEDINVVDE